MRKLTGFLLAITLAAGAAQAQAQAEAQTGALPEGHPAVPGELADAERPGEPRAEWGFDQAGVIPVQSGGRVKPLDTFARETILFITGSRSYEGWHPIDFLFSVIAFPETWNQRKFVLVSRPDVRRQLLIPEDRKRFAPAELFGNPVLLQYANETDGRQSSPPIEKATRSNPRKQEMQRVFQRLMLLRSIASGEGLRVIPPEGEVPSEGAAASWGGLDPEGDGAAPAGLRESFADLIRAYHEGDRGTFASISSTLASDVEARIPAWSDTQHSHLVAEAFYSRTRPFQTAWIIYLLAALLWTVSVLATRASVVKRSALGAVVLTAMALVMHIVGFGLRIYVSGRAPVTNMYESIVWVSLGIMIFALVLYATQRQRVVLAVSSFLAALALIAGDAAPTVMDQGINPLVPVLRSNLWLTVHVLTITLGYAALALTLGFGNMVLYQYLRNKPSYRDGKRIPVAAKVANLNQLSYRAMMIGVVLLAAGTILGGVWADYSWGRFWGWDPKETWALIALLSYVAILHGRYTGWVGQFGFAAWTVIGFATVVMAWYGVNFVLGVGLHSYGFATGGYGAVGAGVAVQLLFVGAVALVVKRRKAEAASRRGSERPEPKPV